MLNVNGLLLFLLAFFIPFPAFGIELSNKILLTPAIVCASCYAFLAIIQKGFRRLHLNLFFLVLAFALTSMFRHGIVTYIFSIAALIIAIAPLTAPVVYSVNRDKLIKGYIFGLWITLGLIVVDVGSQWLGFDAVLGILKSLFSPDSSNRFLGYERPKAGFFEPSYLAIYLAFSYVILDIIKDTQRNFSLLRALILLALIIVGSLSGVLLIAGYFVVVLLEKGFYGLGATETRLIVKRRTVYYIGFFGLMSVLGFLYLLPIFSEALSIYFARISESLLALKAGDLEGSEASRINALSAVFEYWSKEGFVGVLFGTGYANSEEWLIDTYGHLGELSSFARGQQDNLFAAILLSTGIFGFLAYLFFIISITWKTSFFRSFSVVVFFILFHFVYGFLTSYLHWYLLFVLLSILRVVEVPSRSLGGAGYVSK